MVNMVRGVYAGAIQSHTKFTASNQCSDGTCLQAGVERDPATGQIAQYDRLELSQNQCQVTLDVPDQITCEVPRAWTIMSETFESFNEHLQWSLDQADNMNLSFGDRLTFLREEGQRWVEDKRQNDPEMFVAWIQLHEDDIRAGKADLVGLPSDFTMEDYYSYITQPFSTYA